MSGGPRRWREQRWLVDETIRTQTIEFDQPRLVHHLAPVADELTGADMTVIRNAVKKVADHVPVVRSVAERRERWARQAEDTGHPQRAGAHWYAAAQLWSMACWPVWEDDALAHELDDRKNAAYLAWGRRRAAHRRAGRRPVRQPDAARVRRHGRSPRDRRRPGR